MTNDAKLNIVLNKTINQNEEALSFVWFAGFRSFRFPRVYLLFYPFCNQIFHCGQLNMIWVKNKHHINAVKCFYCCVLSCCFVTVKRWKSSKKITGFPVSHIQFGLISKKQETTSHTRKRSCQESSVYF